MSYAFDWMTGFIEAVQFVTATGDFKVIGTGYGPVVNYNYGVEKQFSGIISYEVGGKTYAFGAIDSICNHLATNFFEQKDQAGASSEAEWNPQGEQGSNMSVNEKVGSD